MINQVYTVTSAFTNVKAMQRYNFFLNETRNDKKNTRNNKSLRVFYSVIQRCCPKRQCGLLDYLTSVLDIDATR